MDEAVRRFSRCSSAYRFNPMIVPLCRECQLVLAQTLVTCDRLGASMGVSEVAGRSLAIVARY